MVAARVEGTARSVARWVLMAALLAAPTPGGGPGAGDRARAVGDGTSAEALCAGGGGCRHCAGDRAWPDDARARRTCPMTFADASGTIGDPASACGDGAATVSGTCVHPQLSVGAHAFTSDVAGAGRNPMTTPPVTTRTTGSTFVLFVGAGVTDQTAFRSVADNMGNTYTQVGASQPYANHEGELRAFLCSNCKGGPGHTFTLHKARSLSNWEAVLFAVEVTGVAGVDSFAQADARSSPLSAGSVTTTRAGGILLICALAASYSTPDRYGVSAGFTLLDDQPNGTNSLAGADAWARAATPGPYGGALTSSLASSGAVFLLALSP